MPKLDSAAITSIYFHQGIGLGQREVARLFECSHLTVGKIWNKHGTYADVLEGLTLPPYDEDFALWRKHKNASKSAKKSARTRMRRHVSNDPAASKAFLKRLQRLSEKKDRVDEEWRLIEGCSLRAVSTHGRIGVKRRDGRGKVRVYRGASCNKKYRKHTVCYDDGTDRTWLVHRLVATTFLEIPRSLRGEKRLIVNHRDGDGHNNHVDNLEWVTNSENVRHAYATGLNTGFRKLTHEKIAEVKKALRRGRTQTSLAKKYGVSQATISKIATGAYDK